MKNKFKNWLKNWLLKDELKSIEKIEAEVSQLYRVHALLSRLPEELKTDTLKLIEEEIGGVAIDIHQYSPSWAVINIQGEKANFIKFVDLNDRNIREIQHYFRRFDQQRINADMPNGMPKDMFFKI